MDYAILWVLSPYKLLQYLQANIKMNTDLLNWVLLLVKAAPSILFHLSYSSPSFCH